MYNKCHTYCNKENKNKIEDKEEKKQKKNCCSLFKMGFTSSCPAYYVTTALVNCYNFTFCNMVLFAIIKNTNKI